MNKLLLIAALCVPLPAIAGEYALHPYAGVDLERTSVDYGTIAGVDLDTVAEDHFWGGDIHVGVKPFQYLGFELGYFRTENGDKDIGAGVTTKVRLQGVTLDAMGYLPVSPGLNLLGSAGLVYTKATLDVPTLGSDSDHETKWRLGAGAQYDFAPNINGRAMVHYQPADFDGIANNAWVASVGLNYSF